MEARHGSLVARTIERDLEITNGRVLVRLILRDGGYVQEFHALGAEGQPHILLSSIHKNLIPSSHHRACASPMISGNRPHLFGVCRESLRMVYSEAEIARHDENNVTVRLAGSAQGHSLTCEIALDAGSDMARVMVEDEIAPGGSEPVIEYLMSSYAFLPNGKVVTAPNGPDFTWTPILRPANDHVIGDDAFHSPAVIVRHGLFAAALVPDMEALRNCRPMPAALDLDIDNGLLSTPLISYGFCGYELADGGKYHLHDLTMSRRLPTRKLKYGFFILLDANCRKGQAHGRVARFLWEKRDISRGEPARAVSCWKPTDLRAPEPTDGCPIPPIWFDEATGKWRGCRFSVDGGHHSSIECSTLLYRRLRRARYSGGEDGLIGRCRKYADFLIEARLRSGAIPSWFAEDLTPVSALRSSALTAASVVFLFELARALGSKTYAAAAERSAWFLVKEIVPNALYVDFTCYDPKLGRTFECPDPHTGARPEGGWAVLWSAQALLAAYQHAGNRAYLTGGLNVMDRLCLMQVTADMPWRSETPIGSLVSGNIGACVDMELTAEFAICAMRYGAITGRREYFDRGIAALQAALPQIETMETVRDSISAANAEFGDVFVHFAGKWACGARLVSSARGLIELEIESQSAMAVARIVFAGMRGSGYKLQVNGRRFTASREEMERVVQVRIAQEAPKAERPQFSLSLGR